MQRIHRLLRVLVHGLVGPLIAFASVQVYAHIGGPPVLTGAVGDVLTYTIKSDVLGENQPTQYGVAGMFNTAVVSVFPADTFFAYPDGVWAIQCLAPGTATVTFAWSYLPHAAAGSFQVQINVLGPGGTTPSAANSDESAQDGDPVNLFTGELVLEEEPDLNLGGPMPLMFARYYASGMERDTLVQSSLGPNWSCNFDWRAIRLSNQVDIVTWKGQRIRFLRNGSAWQLNGSPAVPFQLQESGTSLTLGDPREHLFYTFNTNGVLTSVADGRGNVHTLTYNGGLLLQVSDGLGRSLSFVNNGFHQLSSVTDGTRTVRFFFNGSYLSGITDVMTNFTSFSYDTTNAITGLLMGKTLPKGNRPYTQIFDDKGRVTKQTSADGHVRTFTYQAGNVTTLADDIDPARSFTHTSAGCLLSFTDETGRTATLARDASGAPAAIRDRAGNVIGVSWHAASGKPAAITNADGQVTSFTYAPRLYSGITNYDLTEMIFYDGTREQFTYDAAGNILERRDRGTNFWRFSYNSHGDILSVTNPAGAILTQTYNADGTLASRSDNETGTTTFGFDALRRGMAVTNGDGSVRKLTYDAFDRVTALTDERTNTFQFRYDGNGNLATNVDPAGRITRMVYDSMDRLVQHIDRAGGISRAAFDEDGHVRVITNRNGFVATFQRDEAHRLVRIVDPSTHNWDFAYDAEDGLTTFIDPSGRTMRSSFDAMRYLSHQTNAMGHVIRVRRDSMARIIEAVDPMSRTNRFTYEARGLLASATAPVLGSARYSYNNLGLLGTVRDTLDRLWTFNYSAWGRLTNIVDPLNRTESFTYDARGRVRRVRFADGTSCTNEFDGAGNLTRKSCSEGTDLAYAYDAMNRLTNATGIALAYDAEGRVTNTVVAGRTFAAAYDPDGRVTNITYDAGAVVITYTYDSLDRLTRVSDSLTGTQLDFSYDLAGNLIGMTRPNGVNSIYDYDAANRVTRVRHGAIIDLQYFLNPDGEVNSLTATAPASQVPTNNAITSFAYDAAHQLSTAGYSYDPRGRVVSSPGHTFAYDAASRLRRIDAVTNTYDGLDNLQTRTEAGTTTRFFYNLALMHAPIVAERNDGTGQFIRYYVWTPSGRLLYSIEPANGNAVRFFHFDRAGSTIALTSAAGAVTDAYGYSPFGTVIARLGTSTQPFTFIGGKGVRAETGGLYQMRSRYYDPATARFLTRDPAWPNLGRPARLNPYQYARQNPLRYIDPNGQAEVDLQYVSDDVSTCGYLFSGDWFSSLDDLITKIKNKVGRDDCIRTLTIVNHGSKGVRGFVMFDSEHYICKNLAGQSPFSNPETEAKLRELRALFCRDGNIILRVCRAGEGAEGDLVLKAIANATGVPVQGPENEIQAGFWGGWTVPWKTVNPDGYVPPGQNNADIAPVTASSITHK